MTRHEREVLERFLQYGDLFEKSKIIFLGKEEGTGGQGAAMAVPTRMDLFTNPAYALHREFVNHSNFDDGWFISDGRVLNQAWGGEFDDAPEYIQVIASQGYFHWIMQGGNRSLPETDRHYDWQSYVSNFNRVGTGSHMIDWYPFPAHNVGEWPEEFHNQFRTREEYSRFYDRGINNPRWITIKNLYQNYPMELTLSYIGYKGGKFLQQNFFEGLGFKFVKKLTDSVNERFEMTINASNNPKPFMLGNRDTPNGTQAVVLTPFLGRLFGYDDLNVVSSWLP